MKITLFACAVAAILASGSFVKANVIDVPDDYPTIQEGVDAAQLGDIVLVAPDTYTGPLNRDIDFGGKGITLVSSGGRDVTIIDCELLGRGFSFHSGEDTTAIVDGFTIRNATPPSGGISLGGGVRCSNASPIIRNCVFADCVANDEGGAISSSTSAEPTIEDCSFLRNTASNGGATHTVSYGGVIRDCTFQENTAESGGAILIGNMGEPEIEGCLFSANTAVRGGGIYYLSGESNISDCVFYDNAASTGGGVYFQNCYCLPSISGCTFARNTGGGVYNLMGNPQFTRCVFAFDRSGPGFECLFPEDGSSITHCIVFGNAGGDSLCGNYFDNLFVDPRFCGMASGDLTLCDNSPCLPGGNTWDEQIGALGAGGCGNCDSPVEATSWGLIKTLYRRGSNSP